MASSSCSLVVLLHFAFSQNLSGQARNDELQLWGEGVTNS